MFGSQTRRGTGQLTRALTCTSCIALYDAPEDGCIWHPKHVERGKCNKVTLNNLHEDVLNKPIYNDAWKNKN